MCTSEAHQGFSGQQSGRPSSLELLERRCDDNDGDNDGDDGTDDTQRPSLPQSKCHKPRESQRGYLGLSERALEDVDVWETADERLVDLQKVIMLLTSLLVSNTETPMLSR